MVSDYADTVVNGIISDNAIVGEGIQGHPVAALISPAATRTPGIPRRRGGVHPLRDASDPDTPDMGRTGGFTTPTSGRQEQQRSTDDDQNIVSGAARPARSTRDSRHRAAAVTPAAAGVGTTLFSSPVIADDEFRLVPARRQAQSRASPTVDSPANSGPRRRVQRRIPPLDTGGSTLGDPDYPQVVTAFLPVPQNREHIAQRARADEFRPLLNHGQSQLCVWGRDCTVATMWDRTLMACRQTIETTAIRKIDRVLQPIGSIRFNIFCDSDQSGQILKRLCAFSGRWEWHCRRHRPFLDRHPPGNELLRVQRLANRLDFDQDHLDNGDPTGVQLATKPLRVATLNIHGAKKKTIELQHLLGSKKLDLIALQETLLRSTDFGISIPDFQCFSALGHSAAARRGVSVLIRQKFWWRTSWTRPLQLGVR
jgi:hypothetical protein